jgi:two-component system chemotaxis sensor kinase CheA
MSTFDQLKQTFFDECADLLQQIETNFTEIREGRPSDDAINAAFRAVHSIKGGAGIFGFETLVDFAHVFETAMEAVRSGRLAISPDNVGALLAAGDVLADLVAMSRSPEGPPAGHGSECRAALESIMRHLVGSNDARGAGDVASDFDDLDFTPVRADVADDPQHTGFTFVFQPGPDLLRKGNEPLYILRELRALGELDLKADLADLPVLAEMEFDRAYIGWSGTLKTQAARDDVEAIFDFVVNDCDLTIDALTALPPNQLELDATAAAPGSAPDIPLPGIAAAPDVPIGAAPAAKAQEGAGIAVAKPAATTTRVELEKIDRAVNLVGELVIAQAMLSQIAQDLPEHVVGRMLQTLDEVAHHTRELKDSVMSMRAQPVSAVFQRMPRLVRELSGRTGKKVRLDMIGENTEVDRSIIERLADPLTHIVRNSMDHGIEMPDARLAAGKPGEGTITLIAEHRGGKIVIEVRDDGTGINPERVLAKARERGLVASDAMLTDDEINNLIFMPGFSTAEAISDISGRGVGMDVVRRNIQDIGGRISLKSERGRGMTLMLALPLTLAVMDGMVIRLGRETFVVPLSAIVECLRPPQGDLHNLVGTHGMLRLRGELLPIVHLGELLHIGSDPAEESGGGVVIVAEADEGVRFGLRVDELLGHQQVVIKSIEESYGAIPGIAAATILGNGRVAFILDTETLFELAAVPGLQAGASPLRAA